MSIAAHGWETKPFTARGKTKSQRPEARENAKSGQVLGSASRSTSKCSIARSGKPSFIWRGPCHRWAHPQVWLAWNSCNPGHGRAKRGPVGGLERRCSIDSRIFRRTFRNYLVSGPTDSAGSGGRRLRLQQSRRDDSPIYSGNASTRSMERISSFLLPIRVAVCGLTREGVGEMCWPDPSGRQVENSVAKNLTVCNLQC